MSIFEHQRFEIFNMGQHPYRHNLAEFGYANPALGEDVTNVEQAIDWILAVLYPKVQAAVDTVGDLPAAGNAVNDMRVVQDDGDGKAATYRWEQREGDASAQWYKIYDMDWGYDSILSGMLDRTQDIYVVRQGSDDLDEDGVALTGINAGQHIYGGKSANTHLNLHANSGDGVGAQTGYIQAFDNVRPSVDSAWSLGTNAERWLKLWTDTATIGTLTLAAGSITDSSGAIDFGNEDLSTTGNMEATSFLAGGMIVTSGSITDLSGAISFGNENLSTSGSIAAGTLALASGSITDSSGAISFSNENLSTTGTLSAGAITGTQVNADNLRLDGNTLSSTNADGDIGLSPNGNGSVVISNGILETGDILTTGDVDVTGSLAVDNLLLDGSTLSSTNANGNVILDPNGSGLVELGAAFFPTTHSAWDIGKTGNVWNKLWIDGSIGDGTNDITLTTLLSLRDILSGISDGDSIVWNAGASKFEAAAPDAGVVHGDTTGLDQDDHTQYALLVGRSGGQGLTGGTGAGDDLTLQSTSHGTKGNIFFSSVLAPTTDNATDIGDATHQVKDLYMAGELIGACLQNATTAGRPSASASNVGRLVWDTDLKDIFVDVGGSWRQITSEQYYLEDASGWTGAVSTVTYDVSATVNNSRSMIWCLKKNSNNYEQVAAEIDFPSSTSVRVTVGIPLAAGTYTLVGR